MASLSIPRMTKPWKVVAIAMAAFGFVSGYVGTAGAPFCGSLGTCLQLAVDRGPSGFAPASLIPGAISAAFFAAVVYILFLVIYWARNALHRKPATSDGPDQSNRPTLAVRSPRTLALASAIAIGVLVAVRPDDQFAGVIDYFDGCLCWTADIRNTWQFRPEDLVPGVVAGAIAFLVLSGLRTAWRSYR